MYDCPLDICSVILSISLSKHSNLRLIPLQSGNGVFTPRKTCFPKRRPEEVLDHPWIGNSYCLSPDNPITLTRYSLWGTIPTPSTFFVSSTFSPGCQSNFRGQGLKHWSLTKAVNKFATVSTFRFTHPFTRMITVRLGPLIIIDTFRTLAHSSPKLCLRTIDIGSGGDTV